MYIYNYVCKSHQIPCKSVCSFSAIVWPQIRFGIVETYLTYFVWARLGHVGECRSTELGRLKMIETALQSYTAPECLPKLFAVVIETAMSYIHISFEIKKTIYIIYIHKYGQDGGAARGSAFCRAGVLCILGCRLTGRMADEICFQNTKS